MQRVKTYDNGLRLVYENDDKVKALSVRFYVLAGGVNETEKNRGIAHLAEHMYFKGTHRRSSKDIRQSLDELGLLANAYTSQDLTCFYVKGLAENSTKIFDILSDCLFYPEYEEDEIELEKKTVCNEIEMYLDDPKQTLISSAEALTLQNTNYERELIGSVESVMAITRKDLQKWHKTYYVPERIVVSVCGDIPYEKVVGLVNKYVLPHCTTEEREPVSFKVAKLRVKKEKFHSFVKKDTEQAYCFLGYKSINESDERNLTLKAVNLVCGNLMSSRLFTKVREERGLVYYIGHLTDLYAAVGLVGIIFFTSSKYIKEALEVIHETMNELRANGFTEEELDVAKNVLKTSLTLNCITPNHKAGKNGDELIYNDKPYNLEHTLRAVEKLKVDDINTVFNEIYDLNELNFSLVAREDFEQALEILKA